MHLINTTSGMHNDGVNTTLFMNSPPQSASLFIHKLPKYSESNLPNSSYVTGLGSIEISRNISLALENLLLNYDSYQRPGHGGDNHETYQSIQIIIY